MAVTSWANIHTTEYQEPALGITNAAVGTTIFAIEVDNTANAAAKSYLKILEGASPAAGTDGADEQYEIPAATKMKVVLNGSVGVAFTAPKLVCVTGKKWNSPTAPTSSVPVKVWTS